MKKILTVFVLSILFLTQYGHSQNKQTLPLKKAINTLEEKSQYQFFYKEEWLPDIEVNIGNGKPIDELEKILKSTNLSYLKYRDYAIVIANKNDLKMEMSEEDFSSFIKSIQNQKKSTNTLPKKAKKKSIKLYTIGDKVDNNWKATFSGKIIDQKSNEALIGSTVYISELTKGIMTDHEGKFSFSIPKGKYTLEIKSIGYETKRINILLKSSGKLDIKLKEETIMLDELVVEGRKVTENVNDVKMGVENMSMLKIQELPGLMGEADIMSGLKSLSGVSTVGEGAMGINVRGGSVDQNLILLDEIMLFNSSHLFGFYSLFNANILSDMTLYKGSIPSEYGGRLSSTLHVNTKDEYVSKVKGKMSISPISGGIYVDVPIKKKKANLAIAGRYANPTWVIKSFKDPDLKKSNASFYDYNIKYLHKLHKNTELSILTLVSKDHFKLSDEAEYAWDNKAFEVTLKQNINKNLFGKLTYVKSYYDSELTDPVENITLSTGIDYDKIKTLFKWNAPYEHNIDFGFEGISYQVHPGSEQSENNFSELAKEQANEVSMFVNDNFKLKDFSFLIGLRFTSFQANENIESGKENTSYQNFEPRLGISYSINKHSSVKLSYNRTNQYLHLISNSASASPYDIWKISDEKISPQSGNSFSMGYFQNLFEELYHLKTEVYFKSMDNILEFKDFADIVMNPNIESEMFAAKGKAYGIELGLEKTRGRLTGQINYTYSRSERQAPIESDINNGEWYFSSFDKPHEIKADLRYKISPVVIFSTNFIYSSGRPITLPTAAMSHNDISAIPIFEERNNYRTPDYHRMDMSLILKSLKKRQKFESNWILSVYNIYARKNPYSVYYKHDSGNKPGLYKLSVIGSMFPSITYVLKLK
ncbi:TonB-dependent receptor [Aureibacter tunicatorum]|uniref:TonB-dependent receptor n=1 Tax=Aureibacter tunicatorum TaxID=866807 RepID=A0AAE4BQ26_9BACT|nr:TonB-dependent receptor [Aureibacter tunicatorum]MDR6237116.1 hypothetical protein [Aureibacter tunicatorum]BDD06108.1 TonB-dependent receptor [Aureibacter tunicatorum]